MELRLKSRRISPHNARFRAVPAYGANLTYCAYSQPLGHIQHNRTLSLRAMVILAMFLCLEELNEHAAAGQGTSGLARQRAQLNSESLMHTCDERSRRSSFAKRDGHVLSTVTL